MDGDNIQMVYVQETGNFPALTSTIYAQHISNAGNNIWPSPVIVSANTIPFFFFPEPVSDGNDGFFVAFDSSNPINPALIDVFVQHVDSSGILWSPGGTEAIVSNTDNLITGASCFVDSRKEFWVVLRQQDGGQSIAGVTLQKFDSTGAAAFGNTGRVIINATGDLYDPRTINDAFDGIIFSTFYGPFGGMHIMAMKVDFGASLMWSGLPVPIASQNSNKDDLASGKFINNNLIFAWQDDRNGSGIFAQNVRGDGSTGLINGIQTPSLYTVSLCPNPSSGPDLLLPGGSCTLTVTDPLGKMILNEKTDSQKYSFHTLSSLPTGLYTIRVMLENSTHIVRWVKSN
jgi:hypothetical protein